MKKVLCLLVVLVMALGCVGISASAAEYGTVLNNNVALVVGSTTAVAHNSLQTIPVAPIEEDGVILVPLRAVSELLNGDVSYDGVSNTVDIRFGADKLVVIRIGSKQYTVNGRGYDFPVAPKIVNDSTMVPLQSFVEDIIGQTLFYDEVTKLIVISSRRVIKDSATDAAVISTIANAIATQNLPEITVPTYYELDWGAVTGVGGVSYDVGQLKFVSVSASAEPEANNPASNAIDGSVGSFWAIGDVGGDIVCDLGKVNAITEIKVAFAKYNDRAANYEVWVSEDGGKYQQVYSGTCPQGQQWASHSVDGAYRYVKLVANGNSANSSWNSIAEIQAFNGSSGGTGTATVVAEKLNITNTVATSEPEAENNATKAIDGDGSTFWATEGDQSITLDLGSAKTVSAVGVQMRSYDDGSSVNYSVSYSADGTNYTSAYSGQCEPGGSVMETHNVGASARYIKVGVNGSTTNSWASVAEIEVYGEAKASGTTTTTTTTAATGSKLTVSSVAATSEPEAENNGRNVIDGDYGTFWATEGEQSITLDLGSAKQVSSVGVQIRSYDDGRSVNYSVSYSADGTSYTSAFDGQSEPGGSVMENHNVGANARYIRIGANGSTTNSWASICEIEVYGTDSSAATTTTTTATATTAATGDFKNMSTVSGEFVIAVKDSNKVLTVSSDNFSLTTVDYTGANGQLWTKSGSNIKNKGNGFCMDVAEESYEDGGQICVWEGNGGTNQSWTLENQGDYYYIKSDMSGLYLTAVGTEVQQKSKASATKWVISK
ncbi:MAG: discoidin domain-containing protein [Clostridia bacterium]